MQLLIVYSVNVLLVVTAFPELAQFFQCFLQMIVADKTKNTKFIFQFFLVFPKVHLGPCKTSMMDLFATLVNSF